MDAAQYTIFLFISFIASGLTLFLAVYARRQHTARAASTFAYLMVAISIWTFAIGWGMLQDTQSAAFAWAVVRMVAVIIVPVVWLAFSLQFSGQDKWLNLPNILLLSIVPLISILLMVTTQSHQLFVREIRYSCVSAFLIDDDWILGPWFWVHLVYSYSLILLGDFFILREAARLSRQYRLQAAALVFGTLFPLIVNVLFTFHLIPGLLVNYDPLGFTLAGLAFGWGLFRYRFLDLRPIARRLLVDSMSDGMLVIDEQQRIVDLNPSARQILQVSADEVIGSSAAAMFQPQYDLGKLLHAALEGPCEVRFERRGKNFIYDLRISAIYRRQHTIGHLLVLRDISTRKQLEQQLQQLAITDSLTGLYNRRYLLDAGENELARARRYGHSLAVLLFDLDDFKHINDTYGHRAGDRVLKALASVCQQNLRSIDILARYGGEEFTAVLPETSAEQAVQTAERLRQAVQDLQVETTAAVVSVTISVGITVVEPADDLDIQDLLEKADRALYAAKAGGKNRVMLD